MRHSTLHELAKLGAGLVLADFLTLWWLSAHELLPMTALGITIDASTIAPALIFDAGLFILLVHFAWNLGKTPALTTRSYFLLVGTITGIIALAHLFRVFSGTAFVIDGWQTPIWISWIGTAAAAYLSYMSFRLALRWR